MQGAGSPEIAAVGAAPMVNVGMGHKHALATVRCRV